MNGAATESLLEAIIVKGFDSKRYCFIFIFSPHVKGQHIVQISQGQYINLANIFQVVAYKPQHANAKQVSCLLRMQLLVIYTLVGFYFLNNLSLFLY